MEQMMTNIKQQSVEEKIRLQQENERMMSLQLSMDSERKAMHGRMDDELQMVKSKMREVNGNYNRNPLSFLCLTHSLSDYLVGYSTTTIASRQKSSQRCKKMNL